MFGMEGHPDVLRRPPARLLGKCAASLLLLVVGLWIPHGAAWAGQEQSKSPTPEASAVPPYTYLGFLRTSSELRAFLHGETGLKIVQERDRLTDGSTVVEIREDAVVLQSPDGKLYEVLYQPESPPGQAALLGSSEGSPLPNSPWPPSEIAGRQESGLPGIASPERERDRGSDRSPAASLGDGSEAAARFLSGFSQIRAPQPFAVVPGPALGPQDGQSRGAPPGNEGLVVLSKPRKLSPEVQETLRRMIEASQGLVR